MTESSQRRRVMRWMGTWIDKVGSASGWLSLALVLPAPLLLALVGPGPGDLFPYGLFCPDSTPGFGHDPACVEDVNTWFVPLVIIVLLMFLAAWPLAVTWISIRLHGRRRRRLQARFEPRMRMAKDWLMRGDIDAVQYDRMTAPIRRLNQGDAPSERRLLAGQILARLGAIVLAFGVPLAFMAWMILPEVNFEQESWYYLGILVPAAVVGVGVGTLLLVAGLPLRVQGVRGTAALVAESEAAEDAALARARGAFTRPARPP